MSETTLISFEGLQAQTERIVDNVIKKVAGVTAGNIAVFDSEGGIVDSGFSVATDAEVEAYLARIFPNT